MFEQLTANDCFDTSQGLQLLRIALFVEQGGYFTGMSFDLGSFVRIHGTHQESIEWTAESLALRRLLFTKHFYSEKTEMHSKMTAP